VTIDQRPQFALSTLGGVRNQADRNIRPGAGIDNDPGTRGDHHNDPSRIFDLFKKITGPASRSPGFADVGSFRSSFQQIRPRMQANPMIRGESP